MTLQMLVAPHCALQSRAPSRAQHSLRILAAKRLPHFAYTSSFEGLLKLISMVR